MFLINLNGGINPRESSRLVYLWIVVAVSQSVMPCWRWIQRRRAMQWPSVEGRINAAEVAEDAGFLGWRNQRAGKWAARLKYSYLLEGRNNSGTYTRRFTDEEEANEFVRDLQGRCVPVAYDPAASGTLDGAPTSVLTDASVDNLLAARAPNDDGVWAMRPKKFLSAQIKLLLWPFALLAAIGFVVSLWVHLGAVGGRRVAPEPFFWILHVGVFVVFIPAILAAQRLVGSTNRRDFWKVVLRWAPKWMTYMTYGFAGYAVINFALFLRHAPNSEFGDPPAEVWRGFSGHWMAFYAASLAILYSAIHSSNEGESSGDRFPRRD
jgi:hypothetical protein